MATRREISDLVIQRVQERTGGQKPCVLCGKTQWTIQEKFVAMSVSDDPTAVVLGGSVLPTVPVVCGHCGNTHFLNLIILGFKDLSELKADDEPAA